MKSKKKDNGCSKFVWCTLGVILTIAGFITIPPIIEKLGNKVYKKSLENEKIDFDEMGPKIEPFEEETKEDKE